MPLKDLVGTRNGPSSVPVYEHHPGVHEEAKKEENRHQRLSPPSDVLHRLDKAEEHNRGKRGAPPSRKGRVAMYKCKGSKVCTRPNKRAWKGSEERREEE